MPGTEVNWKGVRPCGERLYHFAATRVWRNGAAATTATQKRSPKGKLRGRERVKCFYNSASSVMFCLTSYWHSIFFVQITKDHYQFTPDMRKISILSVLILFAMTCSCQKHDTTAEQQLAQRKMELDAREEELTERKSALDERQKALDERERSLAAKEKAAMNARTNSTDVQGQTADPAQVQAERARVIQQFTARLPDRSQVQAQKVEKERVRQAQRAQSQPQLEQFQRQRQGKSDAMQKWQMPGAAAAPAAEASPPTQSPAVETTSPSPSSTPQ